MSRTKISFRKTPTGPNSLYYVEPDDHSGFKIRVEYGKGCDYEKKANMVHAIKSALFLLEEMSMKDFEDKNSYGFNEGIE